MSGESGKWLRLGDGRELKLIAGSDGPIVVVREKDKKVLWCLVRPYRRLVPNGTLE